MSSNELKWDPLLIILIQITYLDMIKLEKSLRDHIISYKLTKSILISCYLTETGTNLWGDSKWVPGILRSTQGSTPEVW